MHQDKDAKTHFHTYDDQGELQVQTYKDANVYGDDVERQSKKLVSQCNSLVDEFALDYTLDRKIVRETMGEAAWYQKPGLWFVGLGYSNTALEYGIQSALRCSRAVKQAQQAAVSCKSFIIGNLRLRRANCRTRREANLTRFPGLRVNPRSGMGTISPANDTSPPGDDSRSRRSRCFSFRWSHPSQLCLRKQLPWRRWTNCRYCSASKTQLSVSSFICAKCSGQPDSPCFIRIRKIN